MVDYTVLDLFCGLGGFSAAFADSDRWAVTTVDIKERFSPDIQADVFDLRPSDFHGREFDVILASPPCTELSKAAAWKDHFDGATPITQKAKDAVALVYHTVGLIRALAPTYWYLENPQGKLRQMYRPPEASVTYCQYGEDYQKPTDLWGRHPPMTYRTCAPGDNCHSHETHGFGTGNEHTRDPAERAKVPYDLSEAIRDACERALDGETPKQTTLQSVTDP